MVEALRLYEGKIFGIYAIKKNGRCYIKDFIDSLNEEQQKKVLALLHSSADNRLPRNIEKFRKVSDNIWEFKSYQVRILCTFDKGRMILLLNGFIKKQQKTPIEEIKRAERLLSEYKNNRRN